jgi:hypothetical protein
MPDHDDAAGPTRRRLQDRQEERLLPRLPANEEGDEDVEGAVEEGVARFSTCWNVTDVRRPFLLAALSALLVACAAPSPVSAPSNPAAFKQRFAPRIASCVARGASEEMTPQRITALCRCPYDVMAEALSGAEMRSLEEATFGSASDGGAAAMQAIQRIRPLVRERCGVTIGGPPG